MPRVQFLGALPCAHYAALRQGSVVHVYLTCPFVLNWSLMEQPQERQRLGQAARQTVSQRYDLKNTCLHLQMQWVQSLVSLSEHQGRAVVHAHARRAHAFSAGVAS